MLNGIYTVARGMNAFQKENDVLSNNLANVSTVGFKGQQVVYQSFPEILMNRMDEKGKHVIGTKGTGAQIIATYTNFQPGSLLKTDNPLDLAIEGSGFFAVQTPNGVAYTRAGHFTVNELGQMVTEEGYLLLGQNGPIQTMGRAIQVGEDGSIAIEGMQEDQLQIVDFADPNQLERQGYNMYRAAQGAQVVEATAAIRQGYTEASNVNVILGMTQMITATRLYEMSQKTIQAQDETLAKAVNDVGRVNG